MKELDQEVESLVHEIIGAAIEVHKVLGPGYLESVYESALCIVTGNGLKDTHSAKQAVGKALDVKPTLSGLIDVLQNN